MSDWTRLMRRAGCAIARMGTASGSVSIGAGRHCHAADPGLTLKAVDPTTMLTQGAVGNRLQVIFLVHFVARV